MIDTDSTKINRPGYNIRMYWTKFWQPTVHVQQNIFEKALIEAGSPHLYASFGTFCAQIGKLFPAQWVLEHSEELRNRRHFPSKRKICCYSSILQRLTVPQIIALFGRKRCKRSVKIWSTSFHKSFFKNILLYTNCWLPKIISVHMYS